MKKTTQNFLVDATGFAAMVLLAATGITLHFMLPPGSGGIEGRGGGSRPITLLWGLTRHEWGEIHFWIAVVLLAVISVHVVLHWPWVVAVLKGRKTEASGKRLAAGAAALVLLVLISLGTIFGPREQVQRRELQDRRQAAVERSEPAADAGAVNLDSAIDEGRGIQSD